MEGVLTNSTTTPPASEPAQIQAGNSASWARADLGGTYPAASWSLTYYLRGRNGKIDIGAGADTASSGFLVSLSSVTTAGYAAGVYQGMARVANATTGEAYTVWRGDIEILADPATQDAGFDARSFDVRALEAIEAAIAGRLTDDVRRFRIQTAGGSLREIDRLTPAELAVERQRYQANVESEKRAEDLRNGKGGGGRVLVRF